MRRSVFVLIIILLSGIAQSQQKLTLSMEQAKIFALKNNPNYQIQLKKITAQKGIYWSEMMPENPEVGIEFEEVPKGMAHSEYGEKRLYITQEIDFPINTLFRHQLLKADIQKEIVRLEATKREVIFQVKEAYWDLARTQKLVQLTRRNEQLSEDFYQRMVKSYELGESDRLTMLKAKVNFGVSQTKLSTALKNIEVCISHLKEVLGFNESANIILTDTMSFDVTDISKEKHKNRLNEHPDLQLTQLEQKTATYSKRLAYGGFLPKLSFTYFQQEIDNTRFWGGGIGLSIPLWLPGQTGSIRQKHAEQLIAGYNHTAGQLRIQKAFDQAVAQLEKAIEEVNLYQTDLLKEAEEAFRIARQSYAVGGISYLDYIDAQHLLIETRENYLTALFQYHLEKANLEQLTGFEI